MIERLRGTLAAKRADSVLIDVGGIGYRVGMTPRSISELPGTGQEIVVHTHQHVREDQLALFGFGTSDERDIFGVLLTASGVGPKVALAILATLPPTNLQHALLAEDADALTAVPGIGKKTAQKLILDLRSRLDLPDADLSPSSPIGEVREALEGLGYQSSEVREALRGAEDGAGVEEMLRAALKRLGGS
ncbi:MAG: Holliday junction branch migration protein RuvA [Acidimicrobiia bacterium]|nr:Holliday junction branch migration protein RuvA [Acidimicrobiia bacterium]